MHSRSSTPFIRLGDYGSGFNPCPAYIAGKSVSDFGDAGTQQGAIHQSEIHNSVFASTRKQPSLYISNNKNQLFVTSKFYSRTNPNRAKE